MKKIALSVMATLFVICSYAQIGIGTTTPNSTLDVRGSIATSYRAFATNTTATATDNLLAFTGTIATTITLPTAVGCDGRTYMIKNVSTTMPTPVLTVATVSAQTIDGSGSWTLTSPYETITLISNGASWNVSAQSLPGGSGVNWTQDGNSVASQKAIGTTNNFSLPFITNNTEKMRLTNTGNLGIGITSPSAIMHLKAGTATANTAPLKLTAGINLTTPEDGAVEYNGTHFFGTVGSTRYQLDQQTPATFTGSLSGDVTGTQSATVVEKINGTSLAGLSTGILKNTTTTGVPSIAVAADFPTLNQNTTGNAATVTTNANLTGEVTSIGNATTVTNAAVIAKVLTGYASAAGTVAATDNILQAVQKINGNDALKAPLASPALTGTPTAPTATAGTSTTQLATTAFVTAALSSGSLAGDVTGAQSATVVGKINGTSLAGLSTGILKNTTTTGVPSIAVAADFPILNQNTTGNAATVTTNANLTGEVTSVGNATTVTNAAVIAKVLTGYTSAPGTVVATDNILQAVQKINGNDALKAPLASPALTGTPTAPTATAGTSTTQLATTAFVTAALSSGSLAGDVTGAQSATVVGKINGTSLAGLSTGILKNTTTTGVPSIAVAADFPTLNQNTTGNAATVTTNANLTGEVTSVGNATTVTNAAVIAKVLTGYTSAPGTVVATDNILQAVQKINGNDALKAPLASPALTGTPTAPTATAGTSTTQLATTAFVTAALSSGSLAGDVTGAQSATVVGKINGTSLAGLSTGILKNTTTTGVPSIAVAADFPTLNQNTTGTAANVTGTVAVVNGGTGLTSVTTGDLLYGSATNTLSRLSAGTNGQVLTLAGGIPSWATNPGSTDWNLAGNSVTAGSQFLGSTNNVSLRVRTNNTERMVVDSVGNVAIGNTTINSTNPEKLLVDAGNTSSVNAIVGKGSIDSYLQLNIQNNSAGTSASSDVVATANNGSETTNYVDMGINGGNYSGGVMGAANDGYLYTMGNNFLLGTGNAAKSLVFMTGGTSQASNERMRIDGSGNVGIGLTNPTYKLQVNASSNPLFLGGVQTGANTDSLLMIMNGVVKKLSPSALTVSSTNAWGLTGNNNTLVSNYFLGTTNTDPLIVKTNSTQVGRFNQNALALGINATTNNSTQSYAVGSAATIGFNKTNAYAIGNSAAINADNSFAIGNSAVTNGTNSFAIGNGAAANNANSVAIGSGATTAYSISDALAIGTNATANESNSIAIGSNATLASKTTTNAVSAIAIGNNTVSNSVNAVAIGTGASTGYNLTNPITIGVNSVVNGNNGVVIGNGANIGFVANAMALGAGASATSTAANSSAIGYNASATLANEIILGDRSSTALSVGIGTESFSGTNREKLLVDAGTTTSVNAIVGRGSIDSYLQLNIQNNSAGTSASSDVVATANNGNETSNYVDMGINGGNYTGGVMGAANDGYLYTMGNNFLLGTGNTSKSLVFMTGGTSQATNERARIDGSGNFGIGTTSPTQKLDVNGNLRLSGAFMPNNTAGTAGHFLVSAGAGLPPIWFDASDYAWLVNGNTVSSLKTFGTINNYDLPFITNNNERMRINTNGDIGIGTTTFNSTNPEQLIVNAGTPSTITDFQNVIVGKGNTNSYAQLNIQNTYSAAGNSASSDVVATSDNGNESVNFIDMGINSGTNTTTGLLGGGNTSYLYSTGNNFVIGNSTAAKDIMVFTGGTTAANERMRITGAGNVGIGNNNPNSTLSVTGSLTVSYRSGTGAYTVLATDYAVINTGGAATWTLPAANSCAGRVYRLLNQGTGNITLSPAVTTANGATTTTLGMLATVNSFEIISDGSVWRVLK